MSNVEFYKEEIGNKEVFRLKGGTKYLPNIYIQNNENWNKWMVYETNSQEAITNRTFKSKQDCIDFIVSYDEQTENTLDELLNDIKNPKLKEIIEKIDFSCPQQVTAINSDNGQDFIIHAQKTEIANKFKINALNIKLVCSFFTGLLSLYVNDTNNASERFFYIFNNGKISQYTAWKTVSVAMSLFKKIALYDNEERKYNRLDQLLGKVAIDNQGNGFIFDRHISSTNLMYLQKVRVAKVKGKYVADSSAPLTPMFICEVNVKSNHLELTVRNHFSDMADTPEKYIIEFKNS